ncbi:MAG: glucosylceramidase, partial [Gemmatimonadota bacterium]|nr:glucosylceramidase [Gemmatimonadota bacterium]
FGDDECGKFYARAMSVWSVLLACQGFVYEGPKARIGFAPVWNPDDHVSFFTAAEGWGLFRQRRDVEMQVMELSVEWGRLPVRVFEFELPKGRRVQSVVASVGGEVVGTTTSFSDDRVSLTLEEEVVLTAGNKMAVEVSFNL